MKKETEPQRGEGEPVWLGGQGSSFGVTQSWVWTFALLGIMWYWASDLPSLCFVFLIYKMGMVIVSTFKWDG